MRVKPRARAMQISSISIQTHHTRCIIDAVDRLKRERERERHSLHDREDAEFIRHLSSFVYAPTTVLKAYRTTSLPPPTATSALFARLQSHDEL